MVGPEEMHSLFDRLKAEAAAPGIQALQHEVATLQALRAVARFCRKFSFWVELGYAFGVHGIVDSRRQARGAMPDFLLPDTFCFQKIEYDELAIRPVYSIYTYT